MVVSRVGHSSSDHYRGDDPFSSHLISSRLTSHCCKGGSLEGAENRGRVLGRRRRLLRGLFPPLALAGASTNGLDLNMEVIHT